ncbi:MAG: hypothetical protein M0021_09620 [Clostridia bacterium]|nr:hypothetical protein [Clostridia bacterium]
MIREVIMQNIKGVNENQQLTGKDIILGPNGVGKTTRLQALGIALSGYVPGQGKLESETFKLSSNQAGTMTVGLRTDGFHFTRSFIRKESTDKDGSMKVSVAQDLTVSPSRGEKNPTAKKARVLAEMGDFPVMLDFQEFLKLSDSKRREFIYGLSPVKSSSWDREKVEKHLRESLLTMDLEVNNPDQYAVAAELIQKAMREWPESLGLQEGLQSMLEWAKAQESHWKSEKKDAQGAVRKISELKNQLEETDRNISSNKTELEFLQQQLIEVEKQISKDTEKKRLVEQRLAKIDGLQKTIEALKNQVIPDNSTEIDEQIKALQKQITEVDSKDAIQQIESQIVVTENRQRELTRCREDLYQQMADIKANVKALEKIAETINTQGGLCLLSDMLPGKKIGCEKDFTKVMNYINSEKDSANTKLTELRDYYKVMSEELDVTLAPRVTGLRNKIKTIHASMTEQSLKNDQTRRQINQLEQQKTAMANAKTQRDDKLKLYQDELLKLQQEPVEAIAPVDMLQIRVNGLREQIKTLKVKIEEQERAKITLSNLRSSMIDSKKSGYYADAAKYLAEALGPKGVQGELVKEILEPIRQDVQANLSLMGVDREFFFRAESETGKEIFQFGWKNGHGDEHNFDALSTGQQMLLLIALMTTIIDRANPKVKILAIDNIENLDATNFRKVIDGLNKLDGKLDNIILAGVIGTEVIPGWKVWDLGRAEAKANEVA